MSTVADSHFNVAVPRILPPLGVVSESHASEVRGRGNSEFNGEELQLLGYRYAYAQTGGSVPEHKGGANMMTKKVSANFERHAAQ